MREYDKNKALISIHIPKCGGTSFTQVLSIWFEDRLKFHYVDEINGKFPDKYDLKSEYGLCIHGHFNKKRELGVKDYYPEVQQFITILRDPFEVCLSNYFFSKKLEKNRLNYKDGKLFSIDSLSEYLRNAKSYIFNHLPCDITLDNYKEIIEKEFIYIGIVEDLQTSVNCLASKLGFKPIDVGHENRAARDEVIPAEFRADFIERHPLEYALYDYVSANYSQL